MPLAIRARFSDLISFKKTRLDLFADIFGGQSRFPIAKNGFSSDKPLKGFDVIRRAMLGLTGALIWLGPATAQDAAPSYQADPAVYKVIFEDQNFRMIAATWKNGATDKPHAHPLPFLVYPLDDCTLRLKNPDGTSRETKSKAGTAFAGPITSSHTAENISGADCRAILIERK